MGFIHGKQRNPRALNGLAESFVDEPFRRDVQQPQPAGADFVHDGSVFVERQRGIEPPRGDSPRRQRVDLVLHQGDQRRHDEGQTRQEQGGNLIAQRLAAAGRKHDGRRSPGHQVADRVLLSGLELRESEPILKHPEQFLPARCLAKVLVDLHEASLSLTAASECIPIYTHRGFVQARVMVRRARKQRNPRAAPRRFHNWCLAMTACIMSPFAPRKPGSFAERRATLVSSPIPRKPSAWPLTI